MARGQGHAPTGTERQQPYLFGLQKGWCPNELYTPHGIDVDATYHDATAHSRYNTGSHQEAEILAPGGISGDSVYRVWPRETMYDANGGVLSTRVGEPVYNPNFAHLENPRFGVHDSFASNAPHLDRPANESAPVSSHPIPDTPNPLRSDTHTENNGAAPVSPLPHAETPPVQTVPHLPDPAPVHSDASPVQSTPHTPDTAPVAQKPPTNISLNLPAPHTHPVEHVPPPQDARAPEARTTAPDPQPVQSNPHPQQPPPHAQQPGPHAQQPIPHAQQPSPHPQQPTPHEARPAPQDRAPVDSAAPRATPHPDIPVTQQTSHQPPAPSPRELHQAQQVRQAREWYRTQPPEHGRTTPVPTDRTPNAKPAYDFRRYPDAPGGPVAVTSIKVHVTFDGSVTPEHVAQVWEKAQLATDLAFNHGQPLLSGDRILVDLVHTQDPAAANLNIHVTDAPGPWHPANHPDAMAQRLREHLGLSGEPARNGFSPGEIRQLSNDIAKANTPARFEGLENGHRFGRGRLQSLEDPAYQHSVEDALRDGNQFRVGADPRFNPYGQLINDGGPGQLGRGNNCLVSSLAAISSFHGDPQVGLARWPDQLPDGRFDTQTGEHAGLQRAADFLGGSWENFNQHGLPVDKQFTALHDWVQDLGPGSSALVVNGWHATDPATGQPLFHPDGTPVISSTHATVIVFPHDAAGPVWWDPQAGTYSAHPPKSLVEGSSRLMFMTNPSEAGAAHAPAGHPGTNPAVPGATLPHSPGMVDPSIPRGLDLPAETHSGSDRLGSGTGSHEPGDRFLDGRGHRVPELVDENGGGGLHPNQTLRPATDGSTDPSTPNHGHSSTRTGELGHDPIPGPDRNSDPTPDPSHRDLADNRQEHPGLPAHRVDDGQSGVLDRLAPVPGRDLADPGDVPGVAPRRYGRDVHGA
ncbi:hypothetical protein JK358_00510 [Nocardia sp. 2]|uniref:Tox-PL domain-containing protein n=1 Tax=Nocardia acididurans TaxID=2802282 RepID=A0ABS1LYI9_9NOCA|nr:toxin glutamine deamidase domain-containing protein [Nocardia acididurans]MBL1072870.1 hypothetical protein [Nocardia acididurans]